MLQAAIRGLRKNSAHQVRHLLSQLQEMGYGMVQAIGKRIQFIPQRTADNADAADGQVLTPSNGARLFGNQSIQSRGDTTADTADATRHLVVAGVSDLNGNATTHATDTANGRASQSVSSVSNEAEQQAQQRLNTADTVTAVASAPAADLLQVNDLVVLVGEANEHCSGRELTATWTVRRIEDEHVVVMAESVGTRRYPHKWVRRYPR
jgi:hypothetical protein